MDRVKIASRRGAAHQSIAPRLQVPTLSDKVQKVSDIPSHRRVRFNARTMQWYPSLTPEEKRNIVDESRVALERWERGIQHEDLMRKKDIRQVEDSYSLPRTLTECQEDAMQKLRQITLQYQQRKKKEDDENYAIRKKLFDEAKGRLSSLNQFFSACYKWENFMIDRYIVEDFMKYIDASARSTPLFLSTSHTTTHIVEKNHVSNE